MWKEGFCKVAADFKQVVATISRVPQVQKHLDSSAVHAIEAVAAAADEAAATIKAKMKKSAGTALMQLRTSTQAAFQFY